jgi:hypothetical protein
MFKRIVVPLDGSPSAARRKIPPRPSVRSKTAPARGAPDRGANEVENVYPACPRRNATRAGFEAVPTNVGPPCAPRHEKDLKRVRGQR